eukprot:03360.XXX_64377_64487_1 [CDS] Oithona nana genome sequencing.
MPWVRLIETPEAKSTHPVFIGRYGPLIQTFLLMLHI